MRINDDRVGLFNAIEERGDARIESAEKSISAIDVQPDFAPARDSRHLRDRIDGPGVRRTRVGDDGDRNEIRGRVAIERGLERGEIDPQLRVDWNL
jgi:hypothetical protein